MRKKTIFALCLLICIYTQGLAATSIGYISHSTINIGDDIQTIAAKKFLPEDSVAVDREFVSQFGYPSQLPVLVSGWFMHQKDTFWDLEAKAPDVSWPPSEAINPFFISVHFTGSFHKSVFSEKNIEYLKKYSPIGARDFYTLQELEKRGIPSYFSGCLTLTLDNPFDERNNVIYLVDVDEATRTYVKSKCSSPIVEITHGKPLLKLLVVEHRLKYAENLLNMYRKAKCVVTTRLHAAMPCLAFQTPVLMISSEEPGSLDSRFLGLVEHTWNCSKKELVEGSFEYDFENPPDNPNTHLPIRENLIRIMQDWVKSISVSASNKD